MVNDYYDLYLNNADMREAAKTLRTNIEFAGIDKPIKCVEITSAKMAEGKSTIAICLAMAAAEAGKTTLIIDNDLRSPRIATRLAIRSTYSLSDIFSGAITPEQACLPTKMPKLYVLDMGNRRVSNPVEILSSNKYRDIVKHLSELFDFVVIDTPPLEYFIDAAVVSTMVDGVVITIKSGMTTAASIKEVTNQLEMANAHIIGVALSGVKSNEARYGYYYYHYQNQNRGKGAKVPRGKR